MLIRMCLLKFVFLVYLEEPIETSRPILKQSEEVEVEREVDSNIIEQDIVESNIVEQDIIKSNVIIRNIVEKNIVEQDIIKSNVVEREVKVKKEFPIGILNFFNKLTSSYMDKGGDNYFVDPNSETFEIALWNLLKSRKFYSAILICFKNIFYLIGRI